MPPPVPEPKRGVDDDGDGIIDEDFVGYTFPLRVASELPSQFAQFGGQYIHNTHNYNVINEGHNIEIWFPLGFMDLSDMSYPSYAFSAPHDDDGDGRVDEDGAPVSEQDFISYYYDYCPFGTTGDRDLGISRSRNTHWPLNIRARQMSYQWSYDYIKNLVYVEFNITNMNTATQDTLFDCAMGIYMDCDVGPQSWGREKPLMTNPDTSKVKVMNLPTLMTQTETVALPQVWWAPVSVRQTPNSSNSTAGIGKWEMARTTLNPAP